MTSSSDTDMGVSGPAAGVSTTWTSEERKGIRRMIKYHKLMRTYYENRLRDGRSLTQPPKKPKNDMLDEIIMRKKPKMSANDNLKVIKGMSDEDFHAYLLEHFVGNSDVNLNLYVEMPTTNLDEMGIHLKEVYMTLETNILQAHYILGRKLILAKAQFDIDKLKGNTKDTWEYWVQSQTEMSPRYERRLRQMSAFIIDYPNLQYLGINYTDVFKLKDRIEALFRRNEDYRSQWIA
jgi:hypothetical protein